MIDKIINHLNELLSKDKMKFSRYLYVIGGFACNEYNDFAILNRQ